VRKTPGFPCALYFLGERIMHRSGISCRENADGCCLTTKSEILLCSPAPPGKLHGRA
jgi:hypothetical protein